MVILLFEWEKASGFQLLVCSKFWDCVIVCLEISHFIMFYILNKTKAYILCNLNEFSYRWVDFRKSNPLISTHLKLKMCVWQPDKPQRPVHFTIFPFKLLLTSCQLPTLTVTNIPHSKYLYLSNLFIVPFSYFLVMYISISGVYIIQFWPVHNVSFLPIELCCDFNFLISLNC
jgi:hypothetical protein